MKILGYEIDFSKDIVADAEAKKRPSFSGARRSAREVGTTHNLTSDDYPRITSPVRDYEYSRSRTSFLEPEWDLAEIGRIATAESYFGRSIRIKTALMLKEGWELVGKNPETVNYLKFRFKQISMSTKEPFNLLVWRTVSDLIQYSNAFWVKVRKPNIPGTKTRPIKGREVNLAPVAGYFYLPAETVKFNKKKYSGVQKYKQVMPDGHEKEFKAEDVVHFTYDKRAGLIIGTPQIIAAIEDIKLLRKLEENVAILTHKHLFPLFHYKVGTDTAPAKKDPKSGRSEVDVVKIAVEEMPADGAFVTDHRHDITVLGAENKALRIEGYLKHAKQRVFAGLAISGIDVGELDTSNKATSETASRAMIDNVKDYQKVFAEQMNHYVISELLLESYLDKNGSTMDDENIVQFLFPEIDKESQVKQETHALQKWMQNAITHAELRFALGKDPMTDEEWDDTYYNKVQKDIVLIQSIDELSGLQSSVATKEAKQKKKATTRGTAKKAIAANDNTVRPANQHGKATGPNKFKSSLDITDYLDMETGAFDTQSFKDGLLENTDIGYNSGVKSNTYNCVADITEKRISELYETGVKSSTIYQAVLDAAMETLADKEQ